MLIRTVLVSTILLGATGCCCCGWGDSSSSGGLRDQLEERGIDTGDVSDVLLTHSHYDHAVNWVMFPEARIVIGAEELATRDPENQAVPDLAGRAGHRHPERTLAHAGLLRADRRSPGRTRSTSPLWRRPSSARVRTGH